MVHFIALLLITTGIYAILALGQNLITGYTGMLSLCHAAFFAIGAYTTAIGTTMLGLNYWVTLPFAAVFAGIGGLVIGLPTLRLKGDYLAIATLGFGEIVRQILNNWDSVTRGPNGIFGIPPISLFGFVFNPYAKWAFMVLVWVFVVITYILLKKLTNSRMGMALEAIREDEIAASAMGINVTRYKVIAFVVGAMTAGVAGTLYASFNLTVSPNQFLFMNSIIVLCMVVLGGMGNHIGVLIGAFLVILAQELPRLFNMPPEFNQIIFGLILVLMIRFRPQGLFPSKRNMGNRKSFLDMVLPKKKGGEA